MAKPNPNPPQLTPQDIERFWSKVNKAPGQGTTGECWEWQGGKIRNDYGHFWADNRTLKAHRVSLFLATGEWEGVLACHKCDNPPCCNPIHLYGGSPRTNNAEMIERGRKTVLTGEGNPTSRLTTIQVTEIRLAYAIGTHTLEQLAQQYQVSLSNVSLIVNGDAWKHLPTQNTKPPIGYHLRGERNPAAKLTSEQVAEIRSLRKSGLKIKVLCDRFQVCESTIYNILSGLAYGEAFPR